MKLKSTKSKIHLYTKIDPHNIDLLILENIWMQIQYNTAIPHIKIIEQLIIMDYHYNDSKIN